MLAGATVTRSLLGVSEYSPLHPPLPLLTAVIPLFTVDMYTALGPRWASALPGFLALAFTPFPFILTKYGQRIRRWTKYGREADDIVQRMAAARQAAREAEAAGVPPGEHARHVANGGGSDSLADRGAVVEGVALDDGEVEKEIVEELEVGREAEEGLGRSRSGSVGSDGSDGRSASLSMHTALEGRRTPLEPVTQAHVR